MPVQFKLNDGTFILMLKNSMEKSMDHSKIHSRTSKVVASLDEINANEEIHPCDSEQNILEHRTFTNPEDDNVTVDCTFHNCEKSQCPSRFLCLREPETFLSQSFNSKCDKYCKKPLEELNNYSKKQLQVLFEDLTQAVEYVSSQLVQLLLENDALQQESDARNVAIEQLLKMTVKNTELEQKPIQMSVVLPSDNCNNSLD